MDHVKSRGFRSLLLHSSRKFGGSDPGVDLMDHVKSQGFLFLLPAAPRSWGFQTGCRPDGSCKVSRVLVSSTLQLTEFWGFRIGCRPDESCKVSRVLVSSPLQLTEVWGFQTGCRPDGSCKVSSVWFLLRRSSWKFGIPNWV
jgi:hypothetical protein